MFRSQRLSAAFTGSVRDSFLNTLNICAFVIFFNVVIRMLSVSGVLPALARGLSTLLAPCGMTEKWGERLLTGLLEVSSGVWSLNGAGALTGRLSMAAFMLGWAGISVHCQVLSFLGGSGLSPRTYLTGKLLHAGFSALFAGILARMLPLDSQVSVYLTEQVEGLLSLDFATALTGSTVIAWLVGLAFFAAAARTAGKISGNGGKGVV